MDPVMDRERLEAFVDGALSPEDAATIVLHLADCPSDAAYVDALMEANALVAAAYAEPLHQPVPERLRAAIFPEAVRAPVRPAARSGWRALRPRPRTVVWAALAASAALVIGLAVSPARNAGPVQIAGAAATDDALRVALETSGSGMVEAGPAPAQITLIATFFDRDGRPCREYELLDPTAAALTQGIACRSPDQGWATELAVASRLTPAADRGGAFVPAEGASASALDGALDRLGAGMLLTPDEERGLIANDWRR